MPKISVITPTYNTPKNVLARTWASLKAQTFTDWEWVVPDPEDDFGTEFVTLTDCIAVDVTGMDPMPGIGIGWKYVDNEWIPPVFYEEEG